MSDLDTLAAIATSLLAVGAAVGLAWKPVRAASQFFRTVAGMARAVHGVPEDPQRPGSGTPGLLARVDAIGTQGASTAAAVAVIQHEVEHNGGGSIKDAVKRLELSGADISARLSGADKARQDQTVELKTDIANLSTRLDHHIDTAATR